MKNWLLLFLPLIIAGCASNGSDASGYKNNITSQSNNSALTGYAGVSDDEVDVDEVDVNEELDPSRNDGSHTVEACNTRTGSCYDLDADISDGQVENIQFPNGGHLDIDGAELDEDGQSSGDSYTHTDGYDGDSWDITCEDCE